MTPLTIHFQNPDQNEVTGEPTPNIEGEPLTDGRNRAYRQGDTVVIVLSGRRDAQGQPFLCRIDTDKWPAIRGRLWRLDCNKDVSTTTRTMSNKQRLLRLARLLLDAAPAARIRHLDGNHVNCRLSNLRRLAPIHVRSTQRPRRTANRALSIARESEISAPSAGESFRGWLLRQDRRADSLGSLARYLGSLPDLPSCWLPASLGPILVERGASGDIIHALANAHDRFLALLKKSRNLAA